jgi:hypothetical protein
MTSPPFARFALTVLIALLLGACARTTEEAQPVRRVDTLARHPDGAPEVVEVSRGDSVIERRTYRPSGLLSKVVAGDSVRTYFDLNDPDSAAVLRDYLQGRWRNLSADTARPQESVFYVFGDDRLTFENVDQDPLESLDVTYEDNRTLVTGTGMKVRADIASFDTVRVTGYTLVRRPDSL